MNNVGLKRLPEFIEEDFISAVELVVSHAGYPGYPVEISRVSQDQERYLGYDGVLTSLIPFYLQFKRSVFHTPQFTGKTARDRLSCGYPSRRGFFSFALHKDRVTKGYDQHNALHTLRRHYDAAYVAPLFYRKEALTRYKMLAPRFAWTYDDIRIRLPSDGDVDTLFRNVRILHETMTIPPHLPISDHVPSHQYSYIHDGEICFHSQARPLDFPPRTLHEMLTDVLRRLTEEGEPRTRRYYETQRHRSLEHAAMVVLLLPSMFGSNWETRSFRSMLKAYLVDLDVVTPTWNGNIRHFLEEKLGTMDRLLLTESILWNEFRIVQYVARRKNSP